MSTVATTLRTSPISPPCIEDFTGVPRIAYFSMEIAIGEEVPTYAGGLGSPLTHRSKRRTTDFRTSSSNRFSVTMSTPVSCACSPESTS